jgi:hypothetical protein
MRVYWEYTKKDELMTRLSEIRYSHGFNNEHESEALQGALQNNLVAQPLPPQGMKTAAHGCIVFVHQSAWATIHLLIKVCCALPR